jgi:hypothetical protein
MAVRGGFWQMLVLQQKSTTGSMKAIRILKVPVPVKAVCGLAYQGLSFMTGSAIE